MKRLLLVLPLTACATMSAMSTGFNGPPLRAVPEVSTSQFEPTITVVGTQEKVGDDKFLGRYYLRSWIDKKTRAVEHQLYVTYSYFGDWRFYQNANGERAEAMTFTSISRDVGTCPYGQCLLTETFGIDVPDSVLTAHETTGYAVKVYAKSGATLVLQITPQQISSQRSAVASARQKIAE